jgi:hypothetical protein
MLAYVYFHLGKEYSICQLSTLFWVQLGKESAMGTIA